MIFKLSCYFKCGSVLPAGMSVHHLCACCLNRSEDCIISTETRVTDCCEPLEIEPGSSGKQPVSHPSL